MIRQIPLKALIFDLDGVITNTMPDHVRAWKRVFLQEGLKISSDEIYQREGQKGIVSVKELFRVHKRKLTEQQALILLQKKEQIFRTSAETKYIPGARAFLKFLHRKNLKLALVTGTSRQEVDRILPKKVLNLFQVTITGSDVHNGKPHPEPYLKACQQLACQKSEMVVIENAPFGIQSAKHAGLTCLAIETSLNKDFLMEADHIFPSIKELRQMIEIRITQK